MPPSAAEPGHVTVLRREAIDGLNLRKGGVYVDCTFGGGGHSRAIVDHRPPVGYLLAIDADVEAGARARDFASTLCDPTRFRFSKGNFGSLGTILNEAGVDKVDGLLFDLGLSSFQLDSPDRGFAFRFDSPLDMRFDQSEAVQTAADLIAESSVEDLTLILRKFGEEPQARRIARAIDDARKITPITITMQLADIVVSVTGPRRGKKNHPATRTFQAFRIAANRELTALVDALEQSPHLLGPGGRLVVLSFHSLEDRIVKRFIQLQSATCVCPPEQPICTCDHVPTLRKIGKPVKASEVEQRDNPRSRSVIMRVAERLSPDEAGTLKRTLRWYDSGARTIAAGETEER